MRKKYQNPAPLSLNFAFDTRLLDLVASTYQPDTKQPQSVKVNRSSSEKSVLSKTKFATSFHTSSTKLLKNRKMIKTESQSLPKLQQRQHIRFSLKQNKIISLTNEQMISSRSRLKIMPIAKVYPSLATIGQQLNKQKMLKSLRKNILSNPKEFAVLELNHKDLINKLNLKK